MIFFSDTDIVGNLIVVNVGIVDESTFLDQELSYILAWFPRIPSDRSNSSCPKYRIDSFLDIFPALFLCPAKVVVPSVSVRAYLVTSLHYFFRSHWVKL